MEEHIPILLAELGYESSDQTHVSAVIVYFSDGMQRHFIPVNGKFISFCWLENCINAGMRTLQELLDDGPLFFKSAI